MVQLNGIQPVSPAQAPEAGRGVGRTLVSAGLSVGAGLVADRLRASLLSRGNVPAAIAGLAGAAVVKAVGEGAVEVIDNLRHDRDWSTNVGERMVDGLRTGAIDGGLALVARPIQQGVSRRFPQLNLAANAALTGLAVGSLGGAATVGTDKATWQDGAAKGIARVGTAALWGGAGGAALGGVTGAVVQRFFPAYTGGSATPHQVRTLTVQRGTRLAEAANPRGASSWADATAHAKEVLNVTRQQGTNLETLMRQSPELQRFVGDIRTGDVMLVAIGNANKPKGMATLVPNSPFYHAMIVSEAPTANGGGKLIHALNKPGVVEETLETVLTRYLPHGGRTRTAIALVRPTPDGATAQAAADFARAQVGKPFNFSFSGKVPGYFCSQLVHQAYDRNPAISEPVLKILQLDEDTRLMRAFVGMDGNGALTRIHRRGAMGEYAQGSLLQRAGMIAEDAAGAVAGAVRYGASRLSALLSRNGGATIAADYRTQVPEFVSPSELNLADGRTLKTLVIDAVGFSRKP